MIYKICLRQHWDAALAAGRYAGAGIDRRDGYIHFSAAHQVRETAKRHFAGQRDLVLVAVDDGRLGDGLKWEMSRGGALFPHLYGSLDVRHAVHVYDLPLAENGQHTFPADLAHDDVADA
ncbi:MAG: DUF952 domain-containing protein [Fuerstiella sp.]